MTMADKRRPALGRGMAALLSNAAPPPTGPAGATVTPKAFGSTLLASTAVTS